jgi:hypothetical protein
MRLLRKRQTWHVALVGAGGKVIAGPEPIRMRKTRSGWECDQAIEFEIPEDATVASVEVFPPGDERLSVPAQAEDEYTL